MKFLQINYTLKFTKCQNDIIYYFYLRKVFFIVCLVYSVL